MRNLKSALFHVIMVIITLLLSACGGGSGGAKNLGPIVSKVTPGIIEERGQAELRITASDPDGTIREIRWKQLTGPNITHSNGRDFITFIAPEVEADTEIGFLVSVVDNAGAITSIEIYTNIINVNRAPEVADLTLIVTINTSLDFILTATDPDGDTLTYSIIQQPQNGVLETLNPANNQYRYTPNNQSLLDDEITFEVTDGNLSTSAKIIFDIVTTNSAKGLKITEIPSSIQQDDNRWIELFNSSREIINLADYSLRINTINTLNYSDSDIQTFTLPEKMIEPGTHIVIQDRFTNSLWYLNLENIDQLVLFGDDYDHLKPYWTNSGFVELLDKNQSQTIDFVQFGNSHQLPLSSGHWDFKILTGKATDSLNKSLVRSDSFKDTNSSSDWRYVKNITPAAHNTKED